HMVEALRDVVWYVNPEHDTFAAMAARMRSVAAALLPGVDVAFDAGPEATPARIPMVVRQNVFLIYKEALHNVARHARAQRVAVRFVQQHGRLVLRVEDDGAGFDSSVGAAGHGLKSMQARAAQLGAVLRLESTPGRGT